MLLRALIKKTKITVSALTRLSWMRFFGFELGGRMPDENTIRFGLFIRTIGLTRAEAKLTLANLAYNTIES